MLVHPDVTGTISVNLKDVTVFEALDAVRELYGYDFKENTGAVHAQVPVDVGAFLLNEKRAEIQKLEARLKVNIVLVPNPHFSVRPHLDQIVIRVIPEATTRLVELRTGGVHWARGVSFEEEKQRSLDKVSMHYQTEKLNEVTKRGDDDDD